MAFPIKTFQLDSCDVFFSPALRFLGEGLEKVWGGEGTSGGTHEAAGGAGDQGSAAAAAAPGCQGSTHSLLFSLAGVPVPALFPHPQHSELPGKHCRRRKARTVFSDSQLSGLEKRFEIQRYLSTPERVELATALSLSETQVGRGGADPIPAPLSSPGSSRRRGVLEWEWPLSPSF